MSYEELTAFIERATVPDPLEIERLRRHPGNLSMADDPYSLECHIEHGRSCLDTARSDVFTAIYELQRLRAGVVALEDLLRQATS